MTFLELVQELHREAGVAGSTVASVTGQNGEALRLVMWVKQAWHELQLERENWWWMRKQFSLTTSASDNTYTAADCSPAVTDLSEWRVKSLRTYTQSIGVTDQMQIAFKQYDEFRDIFLIRTTQEQRPTHFTVAPDMSLIFGPAPDVAYVVTGEYQAAPSSMAADSDEPTGLPAHFHMAIVFGALMKHGAFDSASEVFAYAKDRYDYYISKLELNQLDEIVAGAPLA